MKKISLKELIFYALCCDMGVFAKTLISPLSNAITGYLHIPGGVGTSFSLLFLTAACVSFPHRGAGTLMGFVQAMIALMMGKSGSMGALAPIGYIVPGIVMDCVIGVCRRVHMDDLVTAVLTNMLASAAACLCANLIVFRLTGVVLVLYVSVSMLTGSLTGLLAYEVVKRIRPIVHKG